MTRAGLEVLQRLTSLKTLRVGLYGHGHTEPWGPKHEVGWDAVRAALAGVEVALL